MLTTEYEPLPSNLRSVEYIRDHFSRVYNEGMDLAKVLVESHPYEGAEMIIALKRYLECKGALIQPIEAVERRRAREAGLSGGELIHRVSVALHRSSS